VGSFFLLFSREKFLCCNEPPTTQGVIMIKTTARRARLAFYATRYVANVYMSTNL
jgi:hypothetical protein